MTMGIRHKQIRPYTPRHNGKVERSHRKDNEMFYAKKTFYSLEDYNKQLRRYMNEYNNFSMRPLGWKSPHEFLSSFFSNVQQMFDNPTSIDFYIRRIIINIHPPSGWFFIFGYNPNLYRRGTSALTLPARHVFVLYLHVSMFSGSNILNRSASLSYFS